MRVMLTRFCGAIVVACALLSVASGPTEQAPATRKKLLFLTHAALYKHASLAPAEKAVAELGPKGGFDVTTLEGYKQDSDKIDLTILTPEYLAQFDGLMLMTNGNLPLTSVQKNAIVEFVRNGKRSSACIARRSRFDYPVRRGSGGYYRRSIISTAMVAQNRIGVLKVEIPRIRRRRCSA
jgi:hypothetical protein